MGYQSIFQRYELKYLLTLEQKQAVLAAMEPYMALDQYGRSTIRNLYLDTDHYRLIRRSIERPAYKEKLRIRSYRRCDGDGPVFVELKKKYEDVVYKRRLSLPQNEALSWLRGTSEGNGTQIAREIEYFCSFYGDLSPKVFLSYEREAFYARDGSDFRVTFDDNVLCRQNELTLDSEAQGISILPEGKVLMELKCSGGIPMWMVKILSQHRIYKTSFSKYGTAYQNLIFPQLHKQKEATAHE